jgi:hypothetical protein
MDTFKITETHHSNGSLQSRKYYFGDKLHRTDGPAVEEYYESEKYDYTYPHFKPKVGPGPIIPDGPISEPMSYRDLKVKLTHPKPDGPAVELMIKKGPLKRAEWYQDNKRHRTNGPAVEQFAENGECINMEYWLDDKQLTKAEFRRNVTMSKLTNQGLNFKGISL